MQIYSISPNWAADWHNLTRIKTKLIPCFPELFCLPCCNILFNDKKGRQPLGLKRRPWDVYAKNIVPLDLNEVDNWRFPALKFMSYLKFPTCITLSKALSLHFFIYKMGPITLACLTAWLWAWKEIVRKELCRPWSAVQIGGLLSILSQEAHTHADGPLGEHSIRVSSVLLGWMPTAGKGCPRSEGE